MRRGEVQTLVLGRHFVLRSHALVSLMEGRGVDPLRERVIKHCHFGGLASMVRVESLRLV